MIPHPMPAILAILVFWSGLCCAFTKLSDATLRAIPDPGSDFDLDNKNGLLAPILIPRVPGTQGSLTVLEHFLDFFKTLPEWRVELHNSTSKTPATGDKDVPFVNIIATRDPPWSLPGNVGRLSLTAHYDSKIEPEGFIGATDSAAPCAMLMHVARSIDAALTRRWKAMAADRDTLDNDADSGVQIILFDGEEAFVSWRGTDNTYGSRALAEHWETQQNPAMSIYQSPIRSISLLLLLDLLGASRPRIPSYFATTHWAYMALAELEDRLKAAKLFTAKEDRSWFVDTGKDRFHLSGMEDDHIPFLHRGVQVFHIIPSPFPGVWHTSDDDGAHLDLPVVKDWAKLVTAFTVAWMDLDAYMQPDSKPGQAARHEKSEFIG